MKDSRKIAILLAVYNGCKYLPEQINSILCQQNVTIDIFISVDKSNDGSELYVKELCKQYSYIHMLPDGLIFGGAAKNFYHLLKNTKLCAFDYIALADQDDIWNPDKLYRAVTALIKNNAQGYSSNVIAFEENGKEYLINKAQPQTKYDFVFEAAGPGCTYVIDNTLFKAFHFFLITKWDQITYITFHDWLIYSFARKNNFKWIIDKEPSMRYRQHSSNQIGANKGLHAVMRRFRMIKNKWYRNQIKSIMILLELDADPLLNKIVNNNGYSSCFLLAINSKKVRRRLRDRIILTIIAILGIF